MFTMQWEVAEIELEWGEVLWLCGVLAGAAGMLCCFAPVRQLVELEFAGFDSDGVLVCLCNGGLGYAFMC